MKKGILIFFAIFTMAITSQLYAFQYTNGSAYVFADLLNWQVREGGNDHWGLQISPIGTPNPTANMLETSFSWNTGFKIGGGYKSPNDWDSVIYFTSYQTQASSQVLAPGQVYSPYLGNFFQNNTNGKNNGPFYNAASVQWKLAYSTLDLELGRTFKNDTIVILRPFLGLKGAVINQNIYTNWQGPNTLSNHIPIPITTFTSATENLANHFSGIGPSFGVDTTWPIYKFSKSSFNLIGNFSTALLWGLWRFKDIYQTNAPSSVTVPINNVNGAAPMVKGFVGLEWVGSFSKANVNVCLGYEEQVWFDQVQFNTLDSCRLNDYMSIQGGVLNASVHF